MQLAEALQGVVSQLLLPTKDKKGRVAAIEIMVATIAIRNLIREAKTHQMPSAIQTGTALGMQSLEQALKTLVMQSRVDRALADGILQSSSAGASGLGGAGGADRAPRRRPLIRGAGMAELDEILGAAVATNASDVYLIEGTPPTLKVDGVAGPMRGRGSADRSRSSRTCWSCSSPTRRGRRSRRPGEANLSYVHPNHGRFRLNCYRALGASGVVLRRVKTEVPSFEELDLPPLLGSLVLERQGLILVVGATGAGKSTTVAAMLHHRNRNAPGHIVTIEDPVEYIHERQQSVISQREVGIDTESYLVALQNALRQAPDVIFVGELRDRDTVAIALHSAETGHLVLSTLHATNATQAVERLLNFFTPEIRDAVLMQLSLMVRAIIAQRLVPRADGKGRVAAMEVMLNTPRIQALIRRGELETIRQAIEEGVNEGLQTMDQSLLKLFQQKKIAQDAAIQFADSPNNLRLRMKGIK